MPRCDPRVPTARMTRAAFQLRTPPRSTKRPGRSWVTLYRVGHSRVCACPGPAGEQWVCRWRSTPGSKANLGPRRGAKPGCSRPHGYVAPRQPLRRRHCDARRAAVVVRLGTAWSDRALRERDGWSDLPQPRTRSLPTRYPRRVRLVRPAPLDRSLEGRRMISLVGRNVRLDLPRRPGDTRVRPARQE